MTAIECCTFWNELSDEVTFCDFDSVTTEDLKDFAHWFVFSHIPRENDPKYSSCQAALRDIGLCRFYSTFDPLFKLY